MQLLKDEARPTAQGRWKKVARDTVKNMAEKTKNVCNKRQNLEDERDSSTKKHREDFLENLVELDTSLAEVGKNQPRQPL